MVQVNNQEREITITIVGDCEGLVNMQKSLINVLKYYNHKDFGDGADETFYNVLDLLEAMLPDYSQQKRGFVSDSNYLELPQNINTKQAEKLKEALFTIKTGSPFRPEKNPVYEALQKITD